MTRSSGVLAALIAFGAATLAAAQAPPPLPGQRGQAAAAPAPAAAAQPANQNLPAAPVVSPKATISAEVTGPGAMFPALFFAAERRRLRALRLRSTRIFRHGHGRRAAVQDAHRHPQAERRFAFQRSRARGVDASERQRVDVPFHASLHDERRPHRRRNRDQRLAAAREPQRGALSRPRHRQRAGQRGHRAGRGGAQGPRSRESAGAVAAAQDGAWRHLGVGRGPGSRTCPRTSSTACRTWRRSTTASCQRARRPRSTRPMCR